MFGRLHLTPTTLRLLSRPAITAVVLFLSAYLGPRASQRHLVLLFGGAGALVLMRRPELGLVALLIGALSVPISIGTGTQTSLNMAVLLPAGLLTVWVIEMVRRQDIRLVSSPVNVPVLAIIVSATLSFVAGSVEWNMWAELASPRAQLGGYMIFVLSVGVLLLVGNQVRDERWLKILTGVFLAVGALYLAGRILPQAGEFSHRIVVDGATGSLFWVWLVALSGGQALFHKGMSRTGRVALWALLFTTLGVGWFQTRNWASGWAPPLVALLVLVWFRSWRLGLVVTLAVGAGGMLVRTTGMEPVSMPLTAQFLDTVGVSEYDPTLGASLVAADQYSIDTRWVASEIVLTKVLPASPILGLGPSNYYHYTKLYPILGWYVNFNSHNQYVDILAQTGILGLAAFSWLMWAIGKLGWRLRESVGSGFARGYVHACLAGLAGTLAAGMLGDWFLPFVYNIGLTGFRASVLGWLFLGGLVAIENMSRSQFEQA